MSLEKIIEKVEEDTEKEIGKIEEETKIERDKLIKKARGRTETKRKKIINKGKKEAELEKQRIISSANVDAKRKILNTKDGLIKKVISEVTERIVKDKKLYGNFLRNAIEEASMEDCEIVIREEDRELVKGYDLAEDTIDESGVIIRKKDGSLTVDNRIKKVMERKKKKLRVGIAEILFESE
ncbi:MAG: V-type ATP synthase subunit E [Euryarchaeota archaeon]|nr:V-type ATP synthase subunit E [Euryarchaeota archaeon]